MEIAELKKIVEAALLAADQPLTLNHLKGLFQEDAAPSHSELNQALEALREDSEQRGIEPHEVASGWRMQVKDDMRQWVSRLWREKPPKYSRALLETMSLIAYRQPITRGEIEQVRGVSVSTNIMRTLMEREWVRIIGHRDVPGRPALYGTTKLFLDYFNLKSLDELPTLAEIKDLGNLEPELDLEGSQLASAETEAKDNTDDGFEPNSLLSEEEE